MKTITILVDDDDARAIDDVLTIFAETPFHDLPEGESDDVGAVLGEVCRAWMDMMFVVPPSQVAICIGCGCNDNAACDGGCEWLAVNRENHRGVCSNCATADRLAAFELEERELQEALA